jgi:integrase
MANRQGKRGHHEGSIYQRKDGRWVGTIDLGWQNGKRKRKSFYGKKRSEVAAKLTKALNDYQQGLPIAAERTTVGQLLTEWLETTGKRTLRPSTSRSYRMIVRRHLNPHLGRIQLAKLTPAQVQGYLETKLASGLSSRTVAYHHAILRRVLNQAVKWGLIARNVATLVDVPRQERYQARALTLEETRQFLAGLHDHRLEALFTVAVAVGLRKGEILGLQWSDVDLDAGTIFVWQQLQWIEGKLQFVPLKTERSRRTIALPAVAVAALRAHKIRHLEERLKAGTDWEDWGLVFTTPHGTPVDPRNLTRTFHGILNQAGLPRIRFHDLRHSCATLLLAQGVDARTIMEVLGHSQISLTLNTYAHVMPQMQREAMARLDTVLGTGE